MKCQIKNGIRLDSKINKPGYHHLRDRYFDKWIKIFEQDDHDEITGRGFVQNGQKTTRLNI